MPLRKINGPPEWQEKAWTQVFRAAVEGRPPPPEEPCHKCIRLFGILQGELSSAFHSIDDPTADAGYAAADVLGAEETMELLAEEGCIEEGFKADAQQAITKIKGEDGFDKEDVQEAFDELMNFGEKILESVTRRCKESALPAA